MLRRLARGRGLLLAPVHSWMLCLFVAFGCVGTAPLQPLDSIPLEAQEALARARERLDAGESSHSPEIWRELKRAGESAPDWIALARFEDDLLAAELRSVAALERRRLALRLKPTDPTALYLVARLEGRRDPQTWERVLRAEPRAAWAQHAHAWALSLDGQHGAARQAWQRAVDLARSPQDLATFSDRFATYLIGQRQAEAARELLQAVLQNGNLGPAELASVRARLARLELNSRSLEEERRGYLRGLELVAGPQLSNAELQRLVLQMLESHDSDDPTLSRLEQALLSVDSETRRELLLTVWIRRGPAHYARALVADRDNPRLADLTDGMLSFTGFLNTRQPVRAVQSWLASLPGQVLAQDGLPRDAGLRAMVAAAHGTQAADFNTASLAEFTRSLLAVGWYGPAAVMAEWIVALDFELGMDLHREALAGEGLFLRLSRLLQDVEEGRDDLEFVDGVERSAAQDAQSLDDLLRRFGLAFGKLQASTGAGQDGEAAREFFANSPRLDFGILAQLVHPGPLYSAGDEDLERGTRGEPVPGLAAAMAEHGRFAIVGEALGNGGPDATVLRRVFVEQRAGEHLGIPWRGTVAWCDGTDVLSRAARGEERIAGAALHEGYWVDLAALRPVHKRWLALREEFDGDSTDARASERLERALESRGLRLETSPGNVRGRRRERLALRPVLEESLRLQLVLMRERATTGRLLGDVSFDELVELTATHEEGHLCDQTRFLPIFQGLPALLMLALDQAFSPTAIRERLEYRAELTALCEVPDPRLSLVNLLEASAAQGDSGLGHGPAYRQLLRNLLRRLNRKLESNPSAWPELSLDHTLVHQLHHLPPEKLRRLAIEEARAEGLVSPDFSAPGN